MFLTSKTKINTEYQRRKINCRILLKSINKTTEIQRENSPMMFTNHDTTFL